MGNELHILRIVFSAVYILLMLLVVEFIEG